MDGKNIRLRLGKSYGFQWLIYILAFACLVPLLAILFYIVKAGITKINIGTLLNVRFTAAVRAHLAADDVATDPRKYLSPARAAVTEAVADMTAAIA